jgi:hypothetical protein
MDVDAEARMPGDAEAAGAVEAMHEQRAGWRAGDRLTFTYPDCGVDSPTAARVIRVEPDGCLLLELVDEEGHLCVLNPSMADSVERLA